MHDTEKQRLISALDQIEAFDRRIGESQGPWYLASPFTNYPEGHQAAWQEAVHVAAALTAINVIVYSPVVHWFPVARSARKDGAYSDFWWRVNEQTMPFCRGVIVAMISGWENSHGVSDEINFFRSNEKPVVFLPSIPSVTV